MGKRYKTSKPASVTYLIQQPPVHTGSIIVSNSAISWGTSVQECNACGDISHPTPIAGYEDIPDTDVKHLNMLPREGDENLPC